MINVFPGVPLKKYLPLLSFLIVIVSCTKDTSETSTDKNGNSVDAPEIQVKGMVASIEVLTDLEVEITSADTGVISTVFLDGEIILTSEKKQFTIRIDPFDYTTGTFELRISSQADVSRKSEVNFDIEIKKFLLYVPDPLGYKNFANDSFIAINTLEGKLVDYKEVQSRDGIYFYAPDGFDRQDLIVTEYFLNKFDNRTYIISYSDIAIGSELLTLQEQDEEFRGISWMNSKADQLHVTNGENHLLRGHTGWILNTAVQGEYTFNLSTDEPVSFYLFSLPNSGSLSSYKYLKTGLHDEFLFNQEDFVPVNEFGEIPIPQGIGYYYEIEAYEDYEAYENNRFHRVFSTSLGYHEDGKAVVPHLEDFTEYQIKYGGTYDSGKHFEVYQRISDGGIEIPIVDVVFEESTVSLQGNMQYNYSILTFGTHTEKENGDFSDFDWKLYQPYKTTINMPFKSFEHPMEVLNLMNNSESLYTFPGENGDESYLSCQLNRYEKPVDFVNLVFRPGYFNNEKGNRYNYTFDY